MQRLVINGRFLTQPVTGVQRYARELVHAIDQLLDEIPDLEVHLLTPRLAGEAPAFRNIIHQTVGTFSGHLWEQLDLPRFVQGATLFCPGNTAPVLSLLGTTKVVVTVHDLSYFYFPKAYSLAFRLLYNAMIPLILHKATVITVSKSEQTSILRYYPFAHDRLYAIQNGGLPVGVVLTTPAITTAEPYILYVGSLSKRKNFPGMLEVACRLSRKRNLRFVFIGGVPDGIAESLTDIPGYARDRIEFLGQVSDWNILMHQYRSAVCFFFPSLYEASPLPPIEAMACGCPVIASRIPSLTERCGGAALYCDPHDVDDMCRTVEMLVDNPALQEELRQKGYKQAEQYRWHNCAVDTLNILFAGCHSSSQPS
jgi:glycosyltransferase involved in cell wall biosynthesis